VRLPGGCLTLESTAPAGSRSGHASAPWHQPEAVAASGPSLLIVDDDPALLDWMTRRLSGAYRILTARDGAQGLEVLTTSGPFAVMVADQRMPGLCGVELLSEVRQLAPETVRVLCTGLPELQTALDAINSGEVFRFLTKPLQGRVLEHTIAAAVEQYQLVTSQRILLSQTLHGSVKVLIDLLAMTSPDVFGHATRVKELASRLALPLRCGPLWQIEIASMLAFVGLLALPEDTAAKALSRVPLFGFERESFQEYPQHSVKLLANIPRLDEVATIIRHHRPDLREGDDDPETAPLASRIIHVASDFHSLLAQGLLREQALDWLTGSPRHSRIVVEALHNLDAQPELKPVIVPLAGLRPGMIIADDLRSTQGGALLLAKGQQLTDILIHRLANIHRRDAIEQFVKVMAPAESLDQLPEEY
jgi:response regulator RpfG family c-di-GMP phosphodiesterase